MASEDLSQPQALLKESAGQAGHGPRQAHRVAWGSTLQVLIDTTYQAPTLRAEALPRLTQTRSQLHQSLTSRRHSPVNFVAM